MHIFKWIQNKAGKAAISLVQAAGLTAVVGAAGFAAYNYLNSPVENNSFMPPSVYENGNVVYVANNGGGGRYTSNGELAGSTGFVAPSRALQLANQQTAYDNQAASLEDTSISPAYEADDAGSVTPKAYQLAGGNLGFGLGGGTDKDTSSVDMLTGLQGQLAGLSEAVTNAAKGAPATQGAAAAQAPGAKTLAPAGQTAAQAANSGRDWAQGRGGSSGNSNAFVLQNSGKNGPSKAQLDAVAQAGNALADARAAMAAGTREGKVMKFSGSRFGAAEDQLANERSSRIKSGNSLTGRGGTELARIRKQTAQVHANKNNAANAGALPFLAGGRVSGGMVVDNSTSSLGGNMSSSDVRSTSDASLRGIRAGLASVQANQDERKAARAELRSWFWTLFPAIMGMIVGIVVLIQVARQTLVAGWWWAAAIALTAVALGTIVFLLTKIHNYADICGHDGWVTWGRILSGILGAGVGAAWVVGYKATKLVWSELNLLQKAAVYLGAGGAGVAGYRMLTHKDQYIKELEEAEGKPSDTEQRIQEENENAEDKK